MKHPTRRQRTVFLVLFVLAAVVLAFDSHRDGLGVLRSGVQSLYSPLQRGASAMVNPIGRYLSSIPKVPSMQRETDRLRRDNAALRLQIAQNSLDSHRADQLASLQLLANHGQLRTLPARVIGLGPSLGFEWTVTIDAGSSDGIKADQTVINGDGLVGRVKHVEQMSSTVVLAMDPGASVGVRQEKSDRIGILTGDGSKPGTYRPLAAQPDMKVGDRLVTGPYGATTYVAGIPVGKITKVTDNNAAATPTAQVRPYVDFSKIDLVGVVVDAPRADPRDTLLPKKSNQ